jgi:hypothetical protein
VHFVRSRGRVGSHSWLPNHTGQANAADEWVWSPLAVSGVSHSPDDEDVEVITMPHMIPSVGLERPLPHATSV